MTQIRKNIGLFAMVPLFAMVLLVAYAGPAFAVGVNDQKPSLKVDSVLFKGQGWYEVTLTVIAGDKDILGGKISISSDIFSRDIELQKIDANSSVTLITSIKANNRSSVDAKISGISEEQSAAVVSDVRKLAGNTNNQQPSVKVDRVLFKGQGQYEVRLTVNAGDKNFLGGKIHLSSDASSKDIDLEKIKAESSAYLVTAIKADSRDSISAKLTEIREKQGPSVTYLGSTATNGNGAYLAQFKVYAGDENVSKVLLSVESDIEAKEIVANGNDRSKNTGFIGANTYGITTIEIIANDPASVKATIVDYQTA